MHDTSARLVERVLPAASYRRWVLTVHRPRKVHRPLRAEMLQLLRAVR